MALNTDLDVSFIKMKAGKKCGRKQGKLMLPKIVVWQIRISVIFPSDVISVTFNVHFWADWPYSICFIFSSYLLSYCKKKKKKLMLSLEQAVEAHRVVRRRGSHIF
jgi:hypothetical protein